MGMDVYIKKYFWLLGVIVVVICSALAATAVGHVVEAAALTDSDKPAARPAAPRTAATATARRNGKDGTEFTKRHMFCSECEPEEPAPVVEGPVTDSNSPPITSLPLRLVATSVGVNEKFSFATVQNTTNDVQGAYWIGDEIPGAGPVVRIYGKFVDFENKGSRRVERIALLGGAEPERPKSRGAPKPPPRTAGRPTDDLMAAVEAGVKKVDDNTFEVSRSLVEKVLANPTAVARGARVVPSVKNGQPNGFKLYAIRPSSVYAKIGLMNGDTLHAVNGLEINSMEKALEVYTKVKESSSLSVSITRRGKPVTLNYSIK
ncbi:MAG TPA: type II secretion system protein GspC [Kofleriaceae bacterium]|nr:type II secretion system protein GspC [Kofleriaceae bacterium]